MKCHPKPFFLAALALAAILCTGAVPALAQDSEVEETPYGEEEYNAYDAAVKEPDPVKRGAMLLEFIEKYPKSALMPHIDIAYDGLMKECSAGKNYELLESHAEKWLKLHPDDVRTLAFVAEATNALENYERCVECYEEIYETKPDPGLAKEIFLTYKKTNNLAKQIEWAEKLFAIPEFDSEFTLRYEFVTRYMTANNIPKAAEYAQLTLKSADLVKDPDAKTREQLRIARRACYHVIGTDLMEKGKYNNAIAAYKNALKAERYGEGYYYIAQCQENLKLVDEAIISYAKAEIVGGESQELAPKAKARLEQLYKALHNNTTIGIEKVYRKAKEELGAE